MSKSHHAIKFEEKLKVKFPSIKCLSPHSSEKLKFKCECGHKWSIKAKSLKGCPKCSVKRVVELRLKTLDRRRELKTIEALSGTTTKFLHLVGSRQCRLLCTKCENEWTAHCSMIPKYKHGGCNKCTAKIGGGTGSLSSIQKKFEHRTEFKIIAFDHPNVTSVCGECDTKWTTKFTTLRQAGCPACGVRSMLKSNRRKSYKEVHDGIVFNVTGNEPEALNWIFTNTNIKPKEVSTEAPAIPYRFNKKSKRYIPDFFIEKHNVIVEVKSLWTAGLQGNMYGVNVLSILKAKAKACIKQGYKFRLLVMTEKGERIKLPGDWYEQSNKELRKMV